MKVRKYCAGLLPILMATLLLGACGRQAAVPDKVYVGVACYNESDVFIGELLDCLKEQLNELSEEGVETTVTIRDAAGSQRTQNDQVKALIDEGSNVLCVNLVDRADPSEIIDLARENDVIMDGRDIGTVIIPDADVKIYVTASDEVRANRRMLELKEKGIEQSFENVLADMKKRDFQDASRDVAPAVAAEDAVILDNSELDREETLSEALRIIKEKIG